MIKPEKGAFFPSSGQRNWDIAAVQDLRFIIDTHGAIIIHYLARVGETGSYYCPLQDLPPR
ncbi:MAG TPA: hypothetical protein VJ936_04645 [Desulfobacteraceae bacterium]|nr:hypothetical protein [Desulfobacteraceae bacterium]